MSKIWRCFPHSARVLKHRGLFLRLKKSKARERVLPPPLRATLNATLSYHLRTSNTTMPTTKSPIRRNRKTKLGRAHVGKAGQLHTMTQFLLRGYNVAVPEVDLGDDLYVVTDRMDRLWKIQVKTATFNPPVSPRAKFHIPWGQLVESDDPPLYYIFVIYEEGVPMQSVIIPRRVLRKVIVAERRSIPSGGATTFSLYPSDGFIGTRHHELTEYIENWSAWPLAENLTE